MRALSLARLVISVMTLCFRLSSRLLEVISEVNGVNTVYHERKDCIFRPPRYRVSPNNLKPTLWNQGEPIHTNGVGLKCCIDGQELKKRDKEEVNETTIQYVGVFWGPLKARISCHVQHLVKGSAVNIYDSNIESFVPSKKRERDEAPPPIS